MDEHDLHEVLTFAVDAARAAGDLTLQYFKTGISFERKPDNTPVTIADRAAEDLLRQRIAAAFPEHGIVGEEHGETPGRAPARWILDPIDGTQSFISGVPLYSVLIGFEWRGDVVAGVIHLPALRETVYAARGLGCSWNDRPSRVSDVTDLSAARFIATSVKFFDRQGCAAVHERLRSLCHVDRGWSDAYGYALLATGRAEVVVDPVMAIWDNAALVPIVLEAGGAFTDWQGTTTHTARSVVATNGALHEAVLAQIRAGLGAP